MSTPHVATPAALVEPTGECTEGEACRVLGVLLDVLGDVAAVSGRAALLTPGDTNELGRLLAPDDPARAPSYVQTLVAALCSTCAGAGIAVKATRKLYKIISVEESERLDTETRRRVVPVMGTADVALPLGVGERGMATIRIAFADGAALTAIEQHADATISLLCTSAKKRNTALTCTLPPPAAAKAVRLFESIGADEGAAKAFDKPSKIALTKVGTVKSYHRLPRYVAEALAVFLQDYARVHCILSAGSISRAVYVDSCALQQNRDDSHTLRAKLHPASGTCLCGVHRKTVTARTFKQLDLRIVFCGAELSVTDDAGELRCRRCNASSSGRTGCCAHGFSAELWCVHAPDPALSAADRADAAAKKQGVKLALPAEGGVRRCLLGIVRGALALARAVGQPPATLEGAEAAFQAAAKQLCETLRSDGYMKPTMVETDVEARSLLSSGLCVSKDGSRIQAPPKRARDARSLAATHGHLFKKLRL